MTSYAARPADSDESAGLAVYEHRSETAEYPNDFPTESAPPPSKIMTEQRLVRYGCRPTFTISADGKEKGIFSQRLLPAGTSRSENNQTYDLYIADKVYSIF